MKMFPLNSVSEVFSQLPQVSVPSCVKEENVKVHRRPFLLFKAHRHGWWQVVLETCAFPCMWRSHIYFTCELIRKWKNFQRSQARNCACKPLVSALNRITFVSNYRSVLDTTNCHVPKGPGSQGLCPAQVVGSFLQAATVSQESLSELLRS